MFRQFLIGVVLHISTCEYFRAKESKVGITLFNQPKTKEVSIFHCGLVCVRNPACRGFIFERKEKSCHQLASTLTKEKQQIFVGTDLKKRGDMCIQNRDCSRVGSLDPSPGDETYGQCRNRCTAHPACISFSFRGQDGGCWIKGGLCTKAQLDVHEPAKKMEWCVLKED